jgi:hypothetical protein
MNIILGAIAIFGLGWMVNELTAIPTLVVQACCFVAIVGILVLNAKKPRK